MTRKLTLFAVCSFEVALILFVVGWTALADVLPNVSVNEQYGFALGKAREIAGTEGTARDEKIKTAEQAFDEFVRKNEGHEREADGYYWLGRIQLFRGGYVAAYSTFLAFKQKFPNNKRSEDVLALIDKLYCPSGIIAKPDPTWNNCVATLTVSNGTKTMSDGTDLLVGWKNGKIHGPAILTSPDGTEFISEWNEGVLERQRTTNEWDEIQIFHAIKIEDAFTYDVGAKSDDWVCNIATYKGAWSQDDYTDAALTEAKLRGLSCNGARPVCRAIDIETGASCMVMRDLGGMTYTIPTKDKEIDGPITITYPSGSVYSGGIDEVGKRTGHGTHTHRNGNKYVGEFKDDAFNGHGTFTSPNFEYVGEFKDDKFHGQGTIIVANEIEDSGFSYAAGTKYVGGFENFMFHGHGTLSRIDGVEYTGGFKYDKPHGQGTYTYPDGRKYAGELKDGKLHGQGTFTYPVGGKYVGEFKDDKSHGQGTFTYPSGLKYVGKFEEDRKHGPGTMTRPDGTQITGEWKADLLTGQAVITLSDGTKQIGEFKEGELIKVKPLGN